MSEFTELTLPISCGECSPNRYFEGYDKILGHILAIHSNYTAQEAIHYAQDWMNEAFERVEQEVVDEAYRMSRRK